MPRERFSTATCVCITQFSPESAYKLFQYRLPAIKLAFTIFLVKFFAITTITSP